MDTRVTGYYSAKTTQIMEKYGPGPRVHFHVGHFVPGAQPSTSSSLAELRAGLVAAQERLVAEAVTHWSGVAELGRVVLDAGCGLGGTSLWWAGELGCEVTALTSVHEHARLVEELAGSAGLTTVRCRVADAHDVGDDVCYDTAMAWEAACYFDRSRWFAGLRRTLRPGGMVFIEDAFVRDAGPWKAVFDTYWRTDIASVEAYRRAAHTAGFTLVDEQDLTAATSAFWDWSIAWNTERSRLPNADLPRLGASTAAHRRMRTAWDEGGIGIRLLAFERTGA
ncbi:methyltransferase domain-containing protein [Streptomyces sp. BPTC-684]|uniref:SAM-dependent methyltransferase n=1 Tax=Streptomyces sp. BPTC-684 TaxID=3043734 RepID=UPI0024B068B6|nr:methyltransferase domain-containing protein [Streptomyces sp. BPTC-684]WHM40994.1 methyltransferase domain-containing protein [Streptomyces sp. BPTC-684]